jgi:hypothetical protein
MRRSELFLATMDEAFSITKRRHREAVGYLPSYTGQNLNIMEVNRQQPHNVRVDVPGKLGTDKLSPFRIKRAPLPSQLWHQHMTKSSLVHRRDIKESRL